MSLAERRVDAMTDIDPTRERVSAYEKALGCYPGVGMTRCITHRVDLGTLGPLGCPVAVAAARVEAERVAPLIRCIEHLASDNPVRERDALRAVVERVTAWANEDPHLYPDLLELLRETTTP